MKSLNLCYIFKMILKILKGSYLHLKRDIKTFLHNIYIYILHVSWKGLSLKIPFALKGFLNIFN